MRRMMRRWTKMCLRKEDIVLLLLLHWQMKLFEGDYYYYYSLCRTSIPNFRPLFEVDV